MARYASQLVIWLAIAQAMAGMPSAADECHAPCIDYAVSAELQNDYSMAGTSQDDSELLDPTIDTGLTLRLSRGFAVVATTTVEPVLDPQPEHDRILSDVGAYLEEIYGAVAIDPLMLKAGKLDMEFGLATNALDGISATDLVGDYDADERWGLEASLALGDDGPVRSVTASLFTTDRTVLSDSAFTHRGRTALSDGGAGNAEGLASAALRKIRPRMT